MPQQPQVKQLLFGQEARSTMLYGINLIHDAIAVTLGPSKGSVSVERSWGAPAVQANASTLLQGLHITNKFHDMGVSLVKQTCKRQTNIAGSGNATSIVILAHMCNAINKHLSSGADPIHLKNGIKKATKEIIDLLDTMKHKISVEQIPALIKSMCLGNSDLAAVITEAFQLDAYRGLIHIESGSGINHKVHKTYGIKFNKGLLNTIYVNNHDTMTKEATSVKLLVLDSKISSIHDLLPVLQWSAQTQEEVVLIAHDIEPEIVSTMIINHTRGLFKVIPLKAPGFGDRRRILIENICTITGAQLISSFDLSKLKNFDPGCLGRIDRIVMDKNSTSIVCDNIDEHALQNRIVQLERTLENTNNRYDQEQIQKDIAQLSGGLVSISIGGANEMDISFNKRKVEDIVVSVKSILEHGFVPGEGLALAHAASKAAIQNHADLHDEQTGFKIVKEACCRPFVMIMNNAGLNGAFLLHNALAQDDTKKGVDALSGKATDVIDSNIITSLHVEKEALVSASLSAELFVLGEVLIAQQ